MQTPADFVWGLLGRVRFGHVEQRAQDLENGKIRHGAAIGEAVAFDVRHRIPGQTLTELEQQTRLPDARLADEAHELSLSLAGHLQAAPEEIQLMVAADESPHPTA